MPAQLLGPEIAVAATAIAALAAASLGWILHNHEFPGKPLVNILAGASLALPAPLLTYYLLAELGHVWQLTPIGLGAAGVCSALPWLLRSSRAAFAALSPAYAKAARSVGASEWSVFARVELPLVWRPVLAATGLALVRLLLELTAAFWIADVHV